jgi:DNA repair photolyase
MRWEPGAALPEEKINSLRRAHEKGIKTWVSLEPVLYPEITLEIIRRTYGFVDEFKVGTLNYHSHAKNID